MLQLRWLTLCSIGFNQSFKRCCYCIGKHRIFRTAPLLLKDEDGLSEIGIAAVDLLLKNLYLRVLAAEAEHRGARDIWVIDIARDQAAEIVRVLACAAATALVQ